jgi:hypothetical protein
MITREKKTWSVEVGSSVVISQSRFLERSREEMKMPPLQKVRCGREPFSAPKAREGLPRLCPMRACGSELCCGHDVGGRTACLVEAGEEKGAKVVVVGGITRPYGNKLWPIGRTR